MPKYLIQASYIGEGVKGLLREGGSGRVEAVKKAAASVGGSVESFYFAFGETDVITILDLPDNKTAAGFALTVEGTGLLKVKTTVLLAPEDIDAAAKASLDYRPPGG